MYKQVLQVYELTFRRLCGGEACIRVCMDLYMCEYIRACMCVCMHALPFFMCSRFVTLFVSVYVTV